MLLGPKNPSDHKDAEETQVKQNKENTQQTVDFSTKERLYHHIQKMIREQ